MESFSVDFANKLMEFNFWESRRVWDVVITPLTDEQFTQDTGYSWGSIQRECIHIMNGEWGWLQRARGIAQSDRLAFEDFVERQAVRQKWDDIQQAWESFMAELTTETFFQPCRFDFRGQQAVIPTWNIIFHVVNHGTIHRAEILRMVADVNEPADIDLSLMQYVTGAFRD